MHEEQLHQQTWLYECKIVEFPYSFLSVSLWFSSTSPQSILKIAETPQLSLMQHQQSDDIWKIGWTPFWLPTAST